MAIALPQERQNGFKTKRIRPCKKRCMPSYHAWHSLLTLLQAFVCATCILSLDMLCLLCLLSLLCLLCLLPVLYVPCFGLSCDGVAFLCRARWLFVLTGRPCVHRGSTGTSNVFCHTSNQSTAGQLAKCTTGHVDCSSFYFRTAA